VSNRAVGSQISRKKCNSTRIKLGKENIMKTNIITAVVMLLICLSSISFAACDWDDQRCYVMTNDYNGTIYMARTILGEWSTPIKVFEDKETIEFVLKQDLLTNIFYTSYLKDGRYMLNMYSMIKNGNSLKEVSKLVRKFLAENPRYDMGGNAEIVRFLMSMVRYDMKEKIVYSSSRWGLMCLDSYGKVIVMIPIYKDKEGQPFSKNSEKIAKGIIAAFDREVKIAREKGQISESLEKETY